MSKFRRRHTVQDLEQGNIDFGTCAHASGLATTCQRGIYGTITMWKVGDRVQKATGYKWPGVVVSVFDTLSGKTRVVVECTVPEVAGALHIYSPEQLIAVGERRHVSN